MTWKEWKSLWLFNRLIAPPAADVILSTPYGFVRLIWYHTKQDFKAWPNTLDSGIVIGWRWPFQKYFRERALWKHQQPLPVAIYGAPMDEIYLARCLQELGWPMECDKPMLDAAVRHIGPTVKDLLQMVPRCDHNLWMASCPDCARKALRMAIAYKAKHNPVKLIDPHEDPLKAFRRRQAEAEKQLGVKYKSVPELPEGN